MSVTMPAERTGPVLSSTTAAAAKDDVNAVITVVHFNDECAICLTITTCWSVLSLIEVGELPEAKTKRCKASSMTLGSIITLDSFNKMAMA
jgi:hypothetical protein